MRCLHDYQRRGVEMITHVAAPLLWMKPGLGKTVTTLTAIEELVHDRMEFGVALVVVPKRVFDTRVWQREADKWPHLSALTFAVIDGKSLDVPPADVVLISREFFANLVRLALKRKVWPYPMVVWDESSCFKDPSAVRFRALTRVRKHIRKLVQLTGTPSPNDLVDAWPQVMLADKGDRWGRTITGFRQQFCEPKTSDPRTGQVYRWQVRADRIDMLRERISDIAVTMTSDDYLQLPDMVDNEIRVPVDLTDYAQMAEDQVGPGGVIAANAAVLAGKLHQMASGTLYTEDGVVIDLHTAKLDALEGLVEELAGQPLIVWIWYRCDLNRIMSRFPSAVDVSRIDLFMRGEATLLVLNPGAAGHGLDGLQGVCSQMCWYTLPPGSAELYEQACDRIRRQGQTSEAVIRHRLVAEGTIDEDYVDVLAGKMSQQAATFRAIKRVRND